MRLLRLLMWGTAAACTAVGCTQSQPIVVPTIAAGPEVPGPEWFKQTGCTACHSISAYNVLNLTAVGPDLSIAVEDVPRRFGMPLEQFLHAPQGTMAMVLSSRIPLTPEQRDTAIAKLKVAYCLHQEQTSVTRPVASH